MGLSYKQIQIINFLTDQPRSLADLHARIKPFIRYNSKYRRILHNAVESLCDWGFVELYDVEPPNRKFYQATEYGKTWAEENR